MNVVYWLRKSVQSMLSGIGNLDAEEFEDDESSAVSLQPNSRDCLGLIDWIHPMRRWREEDSIYKSQCLLGGARDKSLQPKQGQQKESAFCLTLLTEAFHQEPFARQKPEAKSTRKHPITSSLSPLASTHQAQQPTLSLTRALTRTLRINPLTPSKSTPSVSSTLDLENYISTCYRTHGSTSLTYMHSTRFLQHLTIDD